MLKIHLVLASDKFSSRLNLNFIINDTMTAPNSKRKQILRTIDNRHRYRDTLRQISGDSNRDFVAFIFLRSRSLSLYLDRNKNKNERNNLRIVGV